MMTDAPELKPCPFCGGGARIYQDPSHSTAWFCGCEDWDCFGNMMWDETKTGATDKWNRRALPLPTHAALLAAALRLPEVAALVEALDDMCIIAKQDDWDKSLSGRQLVYRNSCAALAALEAKP